MRVDDTRGVEKYKKVQELNWNEDEKSSGKTIKIKGFPLCKKVKIFWATVSANRTEYIVTNDLTQSSLLWCRVWISNSMENRRISQRN